MRFETELFGDLNEYPIWSDEEQLKPGDMVTITNANCEFTYDNINACFENHDLMYCYICELDVLETDLSEYVPEKSNNGGAYAFAKCRVVKVIEKSY